MLKKYRRSILALVTAFALSLSLTVIGSATESTPVSPKGYPGVTKGTIVVNGRNYNITFAIAGGAGGGVCTHFDTAARCIRKHHGPSVTFLTTSNGYETYSGGTRSFGLMEGLSKSDLVLYKGPSTPTSIQAARGTVDITTVDQDGSQRYYPFTTSLHSY